MSEWTYKKLIDCTSDGNLSYGIVQPGNHVEGGIPIIRVNNVNNGQLRLDDVMQVSLEIESKYERTRLEGGEVLLTLVGSTGQSVVVPKELAGWNIARAIAVIRPKPEIGANWINICLQTREVQQFLDERANTTVQKTLNLGDVRELPIPIPPKETKKQIEDIAMALSYKIAINRQINQTLEQMSQAIFKAWFVDFEPVKSKMKAKAEGRDPERAAVGSISGKLELELNQLSSGQIDQYAATAALFPDAMEDGIPIGWKIRTLSELCELNAKAWVTKTLPNQVNYVDLANTKNGLISEIQYLSAENAPSRARRILRQGDTIFGTVRPGNRSFALIGSINVELTGSTGFAVLTPKKAELRELVYLLTTSEQNIARLTRLADGAAYPAVRPEVVTEEIITLPTTNDLIESFHEVVGPLYNSLLLNQAANERLAELRDILLPKLLHGEIVPMGDCL